METGRSEPIAFPAGARRLEGRWRAGSAGSAVIAPPHPEYGGRLDHPVVQALAAALAEAQIATLAFNWCGVGGSEGAPSGDLATADADYAAALVELGRRGGTRPIVAAGYSFGAAAALRAAAGADRLLLVAPPVAMLGADDLRACPRPTAVLVGDADDYAPADLVAALMPAHAGTHLEILPGVDHFFSAGTALARLLDGLRAALT